ncbi:hypothetical protein OLK001_19840 [Synechocystis sp. LKSZ1]
MAPQLSLGFFAVKADLAGWIGFSAGFLVALLGSIGVSLFIYHRLVFKKTVERNLFKLRKTSEQLGERVKEMRCLIALAELSQQSDMAIGTLLQGCVAQIPPAFYRPELTGALIAFKGQVYRTENYRETPWLLREVVTINGQSQGYLEASLSQEIGFLEEERTLMQTLARFLSRMLELKEAEQALKMSERNYREIFNATDESIFIHEADTGKILDVNEAMLRTYGYTSKDTVVKLNISEFSVNEPPYTQQQAQAYLQKALAEGPQVFEWLAKKNNGDKFWVEVALRAADIAGQTRILAVVRNIEERKQQVQKIQYLARLYGTLSQVNQAIITQRQSEQLFQSICNVAEAVGQFRLVWVGLIDPANRQIKPVAAAGATQDYLIDIPISIDDVPTGWGPTGLAARENRLVICKDIQRDPSMLPWRAKALAFGLYSSAAVPLHQGGRVIGVLTFYAAEVGFFTTDEQGLLQEIGDDISFALDAIQSAQEHQQGAQKLQANEERLRLALEAANQGLYDVNVQTGEAIVSPQYATMLGYDPETFVETNQQWLDRLHSDDREAVGATYQAYIQGHLPEYRVEFRQRTAQGDWKWILSLGKIVEWDSEGRPLRMLGTHTDITERKAAEAAIERLAYYDLLTGLPNRRLLLDRLQTALALAQRTGQYGAVLFVDLDRFKTLNDARGHQIGDQLLTLMAQRLQQSLRQADTIARFGGDEFVVLLPELADQSELAARLGWGVAEKIRSQMAVPFLCDNEEVIIGVSIGITVFPKASETLDNLLKEADTAMYQAKAAGRNTIRLFERRMQLEAESRFALERELRQAIAQQQFRVYLQPQVNREGRVVGAEALIRWQHPSRGLVPPMAFIPVAEETGLIAALGEWVLQEACYYLKQLETSHPDFHVSVNVSPHQFRQPNFVANLQQLLAQTAVNPARLILEVTESLIIEDIHQAITTMADLQALGIHFSIDDFGTGYSSLGYLKQLPLNELKIDRSFVQDVTQDPNDSVIVEAVISVAHHFNLAVVAEGVETQEQVNFLQSHNCDYYQGYFYGRPVPMAEFGQFLTKPRDRYLLG